jgi:hypothetical protein
MQLLLLLSVTAFPLLELAIMGWCIIPERSIFTDIVLQVTEEAKRYQEDANSSDIVPFMMERISNRDAENRLKKMPLKERIKLFPSQPKSVRSCMVREMSPQDRKELIKSVGTDLILDSVKDDIEK